MQTLATHSYHMAPFSRAAQVLHAEHITLPINTIWIPETVQIRLLMFTRPVSCTPHLPLAV